MRARTRIFISLAIGLAASFIPPFTVVGLLAAALVFHEGIHSDHAMLYLLLAVALNLTLYFTLINYILKRWKPANT